MGIYISKEIFDTFSKNIYIISLNVSIEMLILINKSAKFCLKFMFQIKQRYVLIVRWILLFYLLNKINCWIIKWRIFYAIQKKYDIFDVYLKKWNQ